MIFLAPVINKYGQILISKNTLFQNKHLNILKTWGIKFVKAGFNNSTKIDISDPKLIELAQNKISKRLLWQPSNDLEIDLYNMAVDYYAKEMLQGKDI